MVERKKVKKAVLAYSGGLDTSVIISWLVENYGCEVIAMVADLGQEEELDGLEEKAKASGASKCFIEDLKDEFAESYLLPVLKAGAIYENRYLLGTAFARPLIAKRQVEIALAEKADALSHGATGKGNDQVRFEVAYKALAPQLHIIAPWKEWEIRSREDAIKYAKERNIPLPKTKGTIYSRDRNLWHLSHEAGILEDPWAEPPRDLFVLTTHPEDAPDEPEYVTIGFKGGKPVSLNEKEMSLVEIIQTLNRTGGKHGIGRVDMVENRLVGIKARGVYETPGGTILYDAHQDLETLVHDRETAHFKTVLAERYAEIVYYGKWFSPLREALDAFVNETQKRVTGAVRLKLYKGHSTVVGRKSPYSLYREDLATFEDDEIYSHADAQGFINLFGLPEKVAALLRHALEEGLT
ncbi:MAG: argininosuccinate synthase [Planctomycetota bacterium]|nr:MAG: argininosuccinate synthase [Planctomycetota bacterium]